MQPKPEVAEIQSKIHETLEWIQSQTLEIHKASEELVKRVCQHDDEIGLEDYIVSWNEREAEHLERLLINVLGDIQDITLKF